MTEQTKRLYRSRDDRIVGGVCAGLGDFFGINPVLVRLGFVAAILLGWPGVGILGVAYLVMLIVVPEEPLSQPQQSGELQETREEV
jgi:phage shock protein C